MPTDNFLFGSVPSIVPIYLLYFTTLYNAHYFISFHIALLLYTWIFLEVKGYSLYTMCSDSESGGNAGEAVKTDRATAGCEEAVSLWHDITLQQQPWEPAHSPADVCVAGVHILLCNVATVCTVTVLCCKQWWSEVCTAVYVTSLFVIFAFCKTIRSEIFSHFMI